MYYGSSHALQYHFHGWKIVFYFFEYVDPCVLFPTLKSDSLRTQNHFLSKPGIFSCVIKLINITIQIAKMIARVYG